MSPTLQHKVIYQLHRKRLHAVSFFTVLDDPPSSAVGTAGGAAVYSEESGRFISHLGLKLIFTSFNVDDTIITKGHVADAMCCGLATASTIRCC